MTQIPLFGPTAPRPPANWSSTSRAAAASMQSHLPAQEAAVLDFIEAAGARGATDEEIAAGLRIRLSSVCARRNTLWRKHAIQAAGTRTGSSGRLAKVWVRA